MCLPSFCRYCIEVLAIRRWSAPCRVFAGRGGTELPEEECVAVGGLRVVLRVTATAVTRNTTRRPPTATHSSSGNSVPPRPANTRHGADHRRIARTSMQYLQKLGKHIEQQWRELGYRHERFADLALTTLQSHAPHEQFSVDELVRWFCANRDVPPQAPDGVFGEPPIAVFESEHFYLEVLFWLDG